MAEQDPTGGARTHLAIAALSTLALAVGLSLTRLADTGRSAITLTAAVAAVHFLVAATYRLSRWRLVRDPHSALAGTALLLVALVAVPSQSLATLVEPAGSGTLASVTLRGGASLIAMGLLLRATRTTGLRPRETPRALLAGSLLAAGALVATAVVVEVTLVAPTSSAPAVAASVLAFLVAACWWLLAVQMRRRARTLAWAGRLSPLLLGMGASELLRGIGQETDNGWTLAALLLTGATGWLALRSAMADLDRTSRTATTVRAHLVEHLETVTGEVEDFTRWRRDLRHDARNTCAGLRAAFAMMEDPRGGLPPEAVGRLHRAAVTELLALEAMLAPETEPGEAHDVRGPVCRAVESVRSLGVEVRLHAPDPVPGLGHPGDLELVVRELLVRACSEPGRMTSPVTVTVGAGATDRADTVMVRVLVASSAGVPPDPADDPGLRAARHLMRRSSGDLVVEPDTGAVLLSLSTVRSLA